jgi:hypothetical protein
VNRIAVVIILMAVFTSVRGDMGPSNSMSGDLRTDTSDVRLVSEGLYIELNDDMRIDVKVYFRLDGPPKSEPIRVYFPGHTLARELYFNVKVNGETVELLDSNKREWYVPFEEGTADVTVNYSIRCGLTGLQETFRYSLITGSKWAGTIGALDIYVKLNGPRPRDVTAVSPAGYEFSGDTFEWHLSDYEPTENLTLTYTPGYGYEAETALALFKNGYIEEACRRCDIAISKGDVLVRKYAKLYVSQYYYFERGAYEKALDSLAKESYAGLGEDEKPFLDTKCRCEMARLELMRNAVEKGDERVVEALLESGSGGKYYKTIAYNPGFYAPGVYLYLENKDGANDEEREYILGGITTSSRLVIEPEYWSGFSKKYPNSPLEPLARYLAAESHYQNIVYSTGFNNNPLLFPVAESFARLAEEESGTLQAWSALAAANCFIESGKIENASKNIEILTNIYHDTSKPVIPGDSPAERLVLRPESGNDLEGLLSLRYAFPDAGRDINLKESFFSSRIAFYLILGDRNKTNEALKDYEELYGDTERFVIVKEVVERNLPGL